MAQQHAKRHIPPWSREVREVGSNRCVHIKLPLRFQFEDQASGEGFRERANLKQSISARDTWMIKTLLSFAANFDGFPCTDYGQR